MKLSNSYRFKAINERKQMKEMSKKAMWGVTMITLLCGFLVNRGLNNSDWQGETGIATRKGV